MPTTYTAQVHLEPDFQMPDTHKVQGKEKGICKKTDIFSHPRGLTSWGHGC